MVFIYVPCNLFKYHILPWCVLFLQNENWGIISLHFIYIICNNLCICYVYHYLLQMITKDLCFFSCRSSKLKLKWWKNIDKNSGGGISVDNLCTMHHLYLLGVLISNRNEPLLFPVLSFLQYKQRDCTFNKYIYDTLRIRNIIPPTLGLYHSILIYKIYQLLILFAYTRKTHSLHQYLCL